jgi:hypothetical protein
LYVIYVLSVFITSIPLTDGKRGGDVPRMDYHALTDDLCKQSILARHVRDLYNGLKRQEARITNNNYVDNSYTNDNVHAKLNGNAKPNEDGHVADADVKVASVVHIVVNNWVHVYCTLCDHSLDNTLPLNSLSDTGTGQLQLQPYQSLLLFDTNQAVLSTLANDCSPLLRSFVAVVTPLLSFNQISNMLQLPLNTIYRLAIHLQYWRQGRIVDHINKHNIYVTKHIHTQQVTEISDDSTLQRYNTTFISNNIIDAWKQQFSHSSLYATVSRFSVQRTVADHLRNMNDREQSELLQQVILLLKLEVLTQLHEYIYYLPAVMAQQQPTDSASINRNLPVVSPRSFSVGLTGSNPSKSRSIFSSINPPILRSSASHDQFPPSYSPYDQAASIPSRQASHLDLNHSSSTSASNKRLSAHEKLVQRLIPYMNGQIPMTQIIRANKQYGVTRTTIKQIIKLYPNDILLTYH